MTKKFTVCACASRNFIEKSKIIKIIIAAQKAGIEVNVVEDLCELCQNKAEAVHKVAKTTIVACHNRAVRSIMEYVGENDVQCVDMRGATLEEVCNQLGIDSIVNDEEKESEWEKVWQSFVVKDGCDAWYPTLEKDKCIECGKCFDFCPFGVYEMVEKKVTVVNPAKCKNNCPSCARMCPVGAIIFPKYDKSPINGGESIEETTALTDRAFGVALREKLEERKRQMRMLKK